MNETTRLTTVFTVRLVILWLAILPSSLASAAVCVPRELQLTFGSSESNEYFNAACETTDGGMILVGASKAVCDGAPICATRSDAWVAKLDAGQNRVWQRAYGGTNSDIAVTVLPQPNGNVVIAGGTTADCRGDNQAEYSLWLLWLDNDGNVLRERTYPVRVSDYLGSVVETPDGGFVVGGVYDRLCGEPDRGFGRDDVWIMRLDSEGNVLWDQVFGGSGSDALSGGLLVSDDGIIFCASSDSPPSGNKESPNAGHYDPWIVQLDNQGNKVWERSYGRTNAETPTAICRAINGDMVVAIPFYDKGSGYVTGLPDRNVWLLKVDRSGNEIWTKYLGGEFDDYTGSLWPLPGGGVMVGGYTVRLHWEGSRPTYDYDLWLFRVDAQGQREWEALIGGPNVEVGGGDLLRTRDGAFYLVGWSYPTNRLASGPDLHSDGLLVKVSPEMVCDQDGDGVLDQFDRCPSTRRGDVVNRHGCNIDQVVPYDARWSDDCAYARAVERTTAKFLTTAAMTHRQRRALQARLRRQRAIVSAICSAPSHTSFSPFGKQPVSFGHRLGWSSRNIFNPARNPSPKS